LTTSVKRLTREHVESSNWILKTLHVGVVMAMQTYIVSSLLFSEKHGSTCSNRPNHASSVSFFRVFNSPLLKISLRSNNETLYEWKKMASMIFSQRTRLCFWIRLYSTHDDQEFEKLKCMLSRNFNSSFESSLGLGAKSWGPPMMEKTSLVGSTSSTFLKKLRWGSSQAENKQVHGTSSIMQHFFW